MANPNGGTRMYYIRQSDGLAYCFSPVPLIAEQQQRLTTIVDDVETKLGIITTYTFNGTLLPDVPELSGVSPDATCIELLDRKSDQLKYALNEDRGNLLVVDATGYPILSVYPRVTDLSFGESQMVQRRDYSVTFENETEFTDGRFIRDYTENWDFAFQEDDTISVSHSVSAVGISNIPAGTGAVQNAKNFVLSRANTVNTGKASFLSSPFVGATVDIDAYTAFNHIRTERIDDTAGSYEITETWIMASGSYKDDRTIDISYELSDTGNLIPTTTINGTVQGYGDTTTERYNAAVSGFENVVAAQIGFSDVTGVISKSRSDNRFSGQVTYSISRGPTDAQASALENRTITRSLQRNEDGTVSQAVSTSASVRLSSASGIEAAREFCFANNYPITFSVEPFFDASLSGNIESVSVEIDEINKSFSLNRTFREQGTPLYREEWQTSREQSLESATTSVSVNGQVVGMAAETSTSSYARFTAASGAFWTTVEPLIRGRALDIAPSGSCLTTEPVSRTVGYNKQQGIVSYDYRYDNRFLTSNPNVVSEQVEATYDLQGDVIAEIGIPGKSDGPILQDQQTKTGLQKSLRISYVMAASGTSLCTPSTTTQGLLESEALRESNILVNNTPLQNARGEKPQASGVFKVADQYSFNRQTLAFNRNVTWKYTAG
jgi:hypothetical protein